MSEADEAVTVRGGRWPRRLLGAALALVALVAAVLLGIDTEIGHRFVADRIGDIRTDNGLRFSVGRIDGSLYGRATLSDVRVYDPHGLVFQAPVAALDWRPFAWLSDRLAIRSLVIPRAAVLKPLETTPTGRRGPILPSFDVAIARLRIDRLELASRVTGVARSGRLSGRADIHDRRALVGLDALIAGSDRLQARIDAAPDRDRFDVEVHAAGAADGVLARLTGIRRPLALDVSGDGTWTSWRGAARARAAGAPILDLALGARSGVYTLSGEVRPAVLTHGKVQRLTAPRVLVAGSATLADRRLEGRVSLRSPALAAQAEGGLDLATSAYRAVKIRARLLRPSALFPNMTGHVVQLRAMLDGAFATARFDYRLDADRFAFDATGFEDAHAAGHGRLRRSPVQLPIRLVAARVTGVGPEAGGILRNLSVAGALQITPKLLIGRQLALRSDKLSGRLDLLVDLDTGRYQVGLAGALQRYLIPGLGVVDVTSSLHAVPGPGGHGTRIVGQGTAVMRRLDNAFFRSLAGGSPRLATGLERTPDGVLHFTNLVLTGPSIRLTGTGVRRRDGTFHFEGGGRQASYGVLTLKLDGRIEKPTIDLVFQRPNQTLGLSGVHARLDPTPEGFALAAQGVSRLGPFALGGAILLPPGGQGAIRIDRLDVSGTRATGTLAIVQGGFDGRLRVAGGGVSGEVALHPQGAIQQVEARLDAASADLAGAATLRRGHLDLTALLDPAGTRLEATATGSGLSRGALRLARFAGHVQLTGGTGDVRASIAGTRGRAFDIGFTARIAPDRYAVDAQGTLDGRAIQLQDPAVITPDGDGWRLSPTRLTFAGGGAALSGRFSARSTALDLSLDRLPLAILDIGYPGLGLGGGASGKLSVAAASGQPLTGRVDLTIRGLTRSGLVLTSQPFDLGLAGVLGPDRAGLRAVMAVGGRTIGRAQAMLSPLVGADLATRFSSAALIGQLRYQGPADALWRLTGIELFDLSGPVSIAADATGRLANPRIRGALQANGARIESATTGTVLTNVQAAGRFDGSRLIIDRFGADAGKGGRVAGTGQFEFAAVNGFGLDLRLQADHAVMINRDDIGATVTGPIAFRSQGQSGVISGDVTLNRSRYRLGQATAASAVPQLNLREINLPGGGEEDEAPRAPWRLDLHAHARDALTVSGLGLNSEWSADLKIGGEPDDPAISGRADLIRGDVEFSGREFDLSRGVIRFGGEVPANPALDIAAFADTTGLTATIRVTGTASKPEINFTSTPALPEDELLSRLLFGTSITNLSAPEALQLASAVAALQSGRGGLDPINAVRRVAGLDRLRILPPDPTTGQGTAVAAGKYINRRLFAEIITDGQGYSATQVEFQVTRWLSLLSSISTLGRTSGNVRVSKDY